MGSIAPLARDDSPVCTPYSESQLEWLDASVSAAVDSLLLVVFELEVTCLPPVMLLDERRPTLGLQRRRRSRPGGECWDWLRWARIVS